MAQITLGQDEAVTISRAVGGDEAAQRTLYEAHYTPAYRLAYLLLQDACDAEEVVQDAFVYVLRNLHRYDAERGSFWAWLRVTLVSRCRNKRRRRQLPSISLEVLDASERSPADPELANDPVGMLELRGAQRAMWGALQEVSSGARDALILRYYEGLPYAEISALLGCSPDAARARVAHGKVQLRHILTRTLADTGEGVPDRGVAHTVRAG
jgi:RNA polymerase sigma-70 factor (ECF subfamily)